MKLSIRGHHPKTTDRLLLAAVGALVAAVTAAFAFMPGASAAGTPACTQNSQTSQVESVFQTIDCGQVIIEKYINSGSGFFFTNSTAFNFTLAGSSGNITVPSSTLFNLPVDNYTATEQATPGYTLDTLFEANGQNCCRQELQVAETAEVPCAPSTTGSLSANISSDDFSSPAGAPEQVVLCAFNTFDPPNVTIAKTANPAGPVFEGNPVGFDITVSNTGAPVFINVADTLQQTGTLDWAISPPVSGCSISTAPQKLSCFLAHFSGTLTIHLTSPTTGADCGEVTNQASWQLAASQVADGVLSGGSSNVATVTVECGGTLTVTKHTLTNGIPDGAATAFPWTFTVSSAACAFTSSPAATSGGVVSFTNVPACSDYVVTESGPMNGYVSIGSSPPSGSIVVTEGGSTAVSYLNVRQVNSDCPTEQSCRPPAPTPTPPPPTPTVAPPTPTVAPPTPTTEPVPSPAAVPATPTVVNVVLGEKTPGPTPVAPSTGTGTAGSSTLNLGFVVLGFLVLAGGFGALALARRRHG